MWESLRAFGTDGEKPQEKALTGGFPCALKLRCTSHFRNNVKAHLKDVNIVDTTKILNQIFGHNVGDGTYNEGMLDADSQKFKECLTSPAVLAYPDFNSTGGRFILDMTRVLNKVGLSSAVRDYCVSWLTCGLCKPPCRKPEAP